MKFQGGILTSGIHVTLSLCMVTFDDAGFNLKNRTLMLPTPLYQSKLDNQANSMIFLTHGGGPMPLLGESRHQELIAFLEHIPTTLISPAAILIISAHWEENIPTLGSGLAPDLYFDYYGFPEESYRLTYPAPGAPLLAKKIQGLFQDQGLAADLNAERGFDHGCFVPLKLMYPQASIPCLQISLMNSLRPLDHIRMGRALAGLANENLLIIGSGSSFHNLPAFRGLSTGSSRQNNEAFEHWLTETLSDETLSENDRENRLLHWEQAPAARYCHPREEHLLPLHVCYGIAAKPVNRIYSMELMGKKVSAYIW